MRIMRSAPTTRPITAPSGPDRARKSPASTKQPKPMMQPSASERDVEWLQSDFLELQRVDLIGLHVRLTTCTSTSGRTLPWQSMEMTPERSARRNDARGRCRSVFRPRRLRVHGRARFVPGRRDPVRLRRPRAGLRHTRPMGSRASPDARRRASRKMGPGIANFVSAIDRRVYGRIRPIVALTPETGSGGHRQGRLPRARPDADVRKERQVSSALEPARPHGRARASLLLHREGRSAARPSSTFRATTSTASLEDEIYKSPDIALRRGSRGSRSQRAAALLAECGVSRYPRRRRCHHR